MLGLCVSDLAGCTVEVVSDILELRLELTLLLLSPDPNKLPNGFPFPDDFRDARSGLLGGLSFLRDPDVNTSLILVPGDIPRLFLEAAVSAEVSNVSRCRDSNEVACCGARFVPGGRLLLAMGIVVDFCD